MDPTAKNTRWVLEVAPRPGNAVRRWPLATLAEDRRPSVCLIRPAHSFR